MSDSPDQELGPRRRLSGAKRYSEYEYDSDPEERAETVVKKRRVNSSKPFPFRLRERIRKKIYPNKQKWGDRKFKYHTGDVMTAAYKIIEAEVLSEGKRQYWDNRDVVVPEVCMAMLEPILEGWNAKPTPTGDSKIGMTGQERCESELGKLLSTIRSIVQKKQQQHHELGVEDEFEEKAAIVRGMCDELQAEYKKYSSV